MFRGVVRPPHEIVSMEGGDFFADFAANVLLGSSPDKTTACGGYGSNIVGKTFPKVIVEQTARYKVKEGQGMSWMVFSHHSIDILGEINHRRS